MARMTSAIRRFPGNWVILALVLLLLLAVGASVQTIRVPSFGNTTNPVVAPVVPQPVAQPFDPSTSLRAQGKQVQQVIVPVAPKIVDYRIVWTEVQDFDPSTIPVEQGIYDASYSWAGKGGYGEKILPHLEGLPVAVAATRDEHNKDVVLASLDADRYGPYLFLSVDGEKSWCRLNLIPITWEGQTTNGVTPEEVRVATQDGEIRLYGRYALGAGPDHLYWWKTVVNKSELPCS